MLKLQYIVALPHGAVVRVVHFLPEAHTNLNDFLKKTVLRCTGKHDRKQYNKVLILAYQDF